MRYALSLVALFLVASSAAAQPQIWTGFVDTAPTAFPATLRISTSESAYVELTADDADDFFIFEPSQGGATAAFFASLTDGDLDQLTWSNGSFSHTVNENHFFAGGLTPPPVKGFVSRPYQTAGLTDLAGWQLDSIVLSMGDEVQTGVEVTRWRGTLYGVAPEPTSAIMLLVGLAHFATPRNRRWRRSSTRR